MLLKLTPLRKVKHLSRITVAFADIETKNAKSKEFRCGCVGHFTSRGSYVDKMFWNFEDMFEYSKNFDVIYFYNVGFDSEFYRNYGFLHNLTERPIESSSKFLGVVFYENYYEGINLKKRKLFALKDMLQFSGSPPCSLEKCAPTWGISEKKFPDFSYMSPKDEQEAWEYFFNHSTNPEIEKHNRMDVYITALFSIECRRVFWDNYGIDIFHKKIYSVPAVAMKVFRTNFLRESIENPFASLILRKGSKSKVKINEDLYRFCARAYKGGYCNAFSNDYFSDLIGADISSAYPFAMSAIRFPVGKAIHTSNIELFLKKTIKIPSIAKVKAYIPPNCGICGIREGKLVEIEGKQIEVLTSLEIFKILREGGKILRLSGYYFEKFDKHNSYAKFASHFYREKSKSKGGKRSCCKLNMNSLYGKTGQSIYQETTIYHFFRTKAEAFDFQLNSGLDCDEFSFPDGILLGTKEESTSIKPFQNVIHASLITAFVRLYLLENAYRVNGRYSDTDSIKFERVNLPLMKNIGKGLGFFEIEHEYKAFRALAPKVYAGILKSGEKIVKMKGVRQLEALDLFDDILEGKPVLKTHKFFRFLGSKESLRVKRELMKGVIFGGVRETEKELSPKLKQKEVRKTYENDM